MYNIEGPEEGSNYFSLELKTIFMLLIRHYIERLLQKSEVVDLKEAIGEILVAGDFLEDQKFDFLHQAKLAKFRVRSHINCSTRA